MKNGARRIFNTYNFEVTSKFLRRNWVWTRIENVDRDRTLLPVQKPKAPLSVVSYERELPMRPLWLNANIGVQVTT